MASTYEPIASTTLGSDVTEVTFSNIAADWNDLVVVSNGVNKYTSTTSSGAFLRLNGDSGTSYSATWVQGNGSTASSGRDTTINKLYLGRNSAGTNPASLNRSVFVASVMSYSNTNVYKTVLSASAAPDYGTYRIVGLWRSTAAITSVSIVVTGTNEYLGTGSTFDLYGIKAA